MTIGAHRESAKIYRFPDRFRVTARSPVELAKPATEPAPRRIVTAPSSSGWYHEAAIEEVEGKLKS